jgi:hypothetical protein
LAVLSPISFRKEMGRRAAQAQKRRGGCRVSRARTHVQSNILLNHAKNTIGLYELKSQK